ncbi:MAPEG family protein [Bradyrhizobium sp. SYSU BS000235]|uniref:MAPEG family protein n=1 Tax=Bradyrhizobium sp. SYSU BS000235 TaxID=3411332 RepID=UPI003C759AA4
MPFAYWCILIAAVLPIVWVKYAKTGFIGDNRHPRDIIESLPPQKRRAYAAHQNAFESFPFFAAAVIIAVTQGASVSIVNVLAGLYVLLRIVHGCLYIGDQPSLRSFVFAAAFVVNTAILLSPLFK